MKTKKFKSLFAKTVLVLVLALGFVTFGLGGHAKLASAACSVTPNASLGTDTMSVSVPTAATYNVWVRMITPTASNNSIYMQVDGGCATNVGGASLSANTWTWVNYQNGSTSSTISVNLSAASHTVLLTGEQPNVGVDSILFLDSSCVPTGNGSNCTVSTPPTISITAPCASTSSGTTTCSNAVSGSETLAANASDTGTVSSVQFKIDSTVVGTVTSPTSGSSYNYTWNSASVANGTHTLTVTATDTANLSSSIAENFTVNNVITPTCTGNPSAPTISAAANGTNGVNVSWTASTPASGCTLSSYTLYRDSTQLASLSTKTTSYSDTGLSPNTQYSYYVTATDSSGHTSSNSNTATATTAPVTTPPSAPTNVVDSAPSPTEVDLSWTASTDSQATVSGYRIYRGGSLVTTVSSTSYKDTSVSAGTSYTYSVSAIDNYGNESTQTAAVPSPITTPTSQPAQDPTIPTNLGAGGETPTSIEIGWTASTDNVNISAYDINIYNANNALIGTASVTASSPTVNAPTAYTYSGLPSSTKYSFSVRAENVDQGYSAYTAEVSGSTTAATSGSPPPSTGPFNYLDLSVLLSHFGSACQAYACGDVAGDAGNPVNRTDLNQELGHWSSTLTGFEKPTSYYTSVYTRDNQICTNQGKTFGLGLWEYSSGTDANSVEAWVSWDPTYLTYQGTSFTSAAFNDIHAFYTTLTNSAGKIDSMEVVRGTFATNYTKDKLIGTLYFASAKQGVSDVYVRWSGTGLAANTGKDLNPQPYGSKITAGAQGAAAPCTSSNNPGGGVTLPQPGSSTTTTSKETAAVVQPSTTAASAVNTVPASASTSTTTATTTPTIYVVPLGSTVGMPVTTNSTVWVSVPTYVVPAAAGSGLSINSVSYYLNSSLQTTKYGSGLAYKVNTNNLANGNYKLVAKEILNNGSSRNIATTLEVNNASSVKQLFLQGRQYLWLIIAVIVVLGASVFAQKSISKKTKGSGWSQASVDPDVRVKSHEGK